MIQFPFGNESEAMRITYATAVAAMLAAGPALAGDTTDSGKDLYEGCKAAATSDYNSTDRFLAFLCDGEIDAALFREGTLDARRFCPPLATLPQEKAKIVVAYMDKHPAVLNQSYQVIIALAFADAWPCSK